MEAFLAKIWEFLINTGEMLLFFVIVKQYNAGVVLRFGKYKKVLDPGFHWKWPFADQVEQVPVLITTMPLKAQSLTTKDGKNVVLSAVIKYKIVQPEMMYTHVYDAVDAISDLTMGIIKTQVLNRSWDECLSNDLENDITKKTRLEAKKWGIEVSAVTLTSIGTIKSIRLIQDTQLSNDISS